MLHLHDRFYKADYSDEEFLQILRDATEFCCSDPSLSLEEGKDEHGYYIVINPVFKTLDDLKAARLRELEDSFDARVSGSVTINPGSYRMQFDTSDSLKMQGAITLMETTGQTEGYLTQADDTTIYHVPLETMKAVLVEMLAAYAQCHARKQALRSQINAAQSEEELNAIEITWPV